MAVPYTFSNQTGNILLSELDANFANVQAFVYTANTVVASAQSNITSVGTLTSLAVSGDTALTGNLTVDNLFTANDIDVTGQLTVNWLTGNGTPEAGPGILASTANIYDIGQSSVPFANAYFHANVYANNFVASATVTATGNVTGGALYSSGVAVVTGNVRGGNLISNGSVSATGNVTGANLSVAGTFVNAGVEVIAPNYINLTGNAQPANLSGTTSTNFIVANTTGYTCTVNYPFTPVDGQIVRFTVVGNTVTLLTGTGFNTVSPSFAGSTAAGVGYKYVYRANNTTWYRSI